MTPLPDNTKIVIRIDPFGNIVSTASNIARNLNVTVARSVAEFRDASLGLPFNSNRLADPTLELVGASFENVGTYTPAS